MGIADLADLMNHTITVHRKSTLPRDKYGKPIGSGAGTQYTNCRVQTEDKLIRNSQGKEVFETGRVYVLGTCTVDIGDEIQLPSGATPVVIKIDGVDDEAGASHTVIHFADGA